MDLDESPTTTTTTARKVRFQPKGPSRRRTKPVAPKLEEEASEDDDQSVQDLLRRVNEHIGQRRPKVEKKSSVHVAFGHGSESSSSIKTYGKLRDWNVGKSDSLVITDSTRADEQITVPSPSTSSAEGTKGSSVVRLDTSLPQKIKNDYKEPWDYNHSYYPVTLPLRRPYSGDPEQLDEEEFGKAAGYGDYDEDVTNSAAELNLMDGNEKEQMLFLQFPPHLPVVRRGATADKQISIDNPKLPSMQGALLVARGANLAGNSAPSRGTGSSAAAKGKEKLGSKDQGVSPGSKRNETVGSSSVIPQRRSSPTKGCSLEDLPAGYMGKMLVYKSGAVKLKLGDTLYDVSPGSSCIFAEDVVAINTVDKDCSVIGEIRKRAIITPDIDSVLDDEMDLN